MKAIICFTSCCIFCLPSLALGADEELLAQWNYLLTGWETARNEVHSGEFTFSGKDVRFGKITNEDPPALVDETVTFEFSGGAGFRHETDSFFHSMVWKQLVAGGAPLVDHAKSESWILTEGKLYEWSHLLNGGFVSIKLASQCPSHSWHKLDPRGLGVAGIEELVCSDSKDTYVESRRFLRELFRPTSIEKEGSLHHVTGEWEVGAGGGLEKISSRITFDESKGLAVVHAIHRFDPTGKYDFVDIDISVEWQQISDVWVPIKVTEQRLSGRSKATCELNWTSVNQPIDDAVFDFHAHPSTQGKRILDR